MQVGKSSSRVFARPLSGSFGSFLLDVPLERKLQCQKSNRFLKKKTKTSDTVKRFCSKDKNKKLPEKQRIPTIYRSIEKANTTLGLDHVRKAARAGNRRIFVKGHLRRTLSGSTLKTHLLRRAARSDKLTNECNQKRSKIGESNPNMLCSSN